MRSESSMKTEGTVKRDDRQNASSLPLKMFGIADLRTNCPMAGLNGLTLTRREDMAV